MTLRESLQKNMFDLCKPGQDVNAFSDAALATFRTWLAENGMVVVPREATEEMVKFARRTTLLHGPAMPSEFYQAAYQGALSVAPATGLEGETGGD